jgi:hypothetical protein
MLNALGLLIIIKAEEKGRKWMYVCRGNKRFQSVTTVGEILNYKGCFASKLVLKSRL